MSLRKYFQTSLDLPGVAGAFCINAKGELVENFMPAPYSDEIFEELGPRLVALTEAVDMSYSQTNELLLQFDSSALFLRRNENMLIGFFTVRNPLLSGLRVSANLLLKQAKSEFDVALKALQSKNEFPGPGKAEQFDEDEEEDPVILHSTSVKAAKPQPETKRRGLFRRKKTEKKEADDIWG